jgi:carbonic anhydrase
LSVNYIVDDKAVNKQFFYDGDRLLMDINLGTITYTNTANGAQEVYEAYKIEIHFPSEHYITINNKTPRYEIELQIYHNLIKTNNQLVTNSQIKVNRAVLSILFTLGPQEEGDIFFNNLGISKYNINQYGKINIPKEKEFLSFAKPVAPASYGTGFNYSTFQGLINLINADSGIFFYYGSETTPPCREDVLWIVFAQPRSIASVQTDFLKSLLAKQIQKHDLKGVKINESNKLFGNNRKINVIFHF